MAEHGTSFIIGTPAHAIQFLIIYRFVSYASHPGIKATTTAIHYTLNELTE
jgi:hypothetical protein